MVSSEKNQKKMKTISSPSPLRRSERNRNISSSSATTNTTSINNNNNHSPSTSRTSVTKRHVSVKHLSFEEKDDSNLRDKRMDARAYRASLPKQKNKARHHKESNSTDKSTPEDSNIGGDKIAESSEGISLHCKEVFEDCVLPSEDTKAMDMTAESTSSGPVKEQLENNVTLGSTVAPSNSITHETSKTPERVQSDCHEEDTSQMLASTNSDSNGSLIRKCVGNDKGENLTPSKRKSSVVEKSSDVSATLVDDDNRNLSVNANSAKLCCNVVETSGRSKRIRGINNVDQDTSKSNDEESCSRNKEGKSGDSVEIPQGNNVETEKIRKQQRSLHQSLKPEIAKLCEILLLPDNVKSMVGKFLEYTMNNYKICTEPVSILQAFQLSLCWTAASLLRHKLDIEASLICAKQHLSFACNKDAVDEINTMLWDLKDSFLLLTGNSNVSCSPKAKSSNRVHSNTDITSDVELTKKDISRNINESQKLKKKMRKLLHMQQEHKLKLEKDFETEETDLLKRYQVECDMIKKCSKMGKEKPNAYKSDYIRKLNVLKAEHKVRLQILETMQLEARRKLREALAPEHGTPHNAPKNLLTPRVERATASELSREAAVGLPSTVKSIDYPENAAPLNSSSTDQISDGGLDGVVSSTPCISSSPSNGRPVAISLLNLPSSTQQVPDRVLPSITDGQIPVKVPELCRAEAVGLPSTVRSTDLPENRAPLKSSSTDQIFDGGLEGVVSSTPYISSTPSNGCPATSPLLNSPSTQQIPDIVFPTITDGQIPVIVPENSTEEAECQLTDVVVNEKNTSDCQEVVHRTMTENTLSQETPVSRPVDPVDPQEQVQVQPISSVESVPSPVIILPPNQSNHISMVMEPPEQVQQLPSSGFLSSNQDFSNLPSATVVEDQVPISEDALSSQFREASTEVQNQTIELPAPNLVVDSHSHHVVPPVSNMVLELLVPSGVRVQPSDTRNFSAQRVINNHPIQTVAQAASRNVPPLYHDPLGYELERIRKLTEQNLKNQEHAKLQLKCNFEKEIEELRRKYDIQLKEIDVEFQKARNNYDTQYKTVHAHKMLAEAMKANSYHMLSGSSEMLQDAGLLSQLSRQQNATRPPLVASQYSRGPPAAISQNMHATSGSHTMVPPPPIQASYNPSGNFSSFSPRLLHINSISSPSGNLQAGGEMRARAPHLPPYRLSTSVPASSPSGEVRPLPLHLPPYRPSTLVPASSLSGEIRAPAPHLLPYRPSTSVPASGLSGEIRTRAPHLPPYRPSTSLPTSNLSGVPHGMLNQPVPSNSSASSLSLSQQLPRPTAISQFGTHRGHGHENTGGFPTPNVSAMDMRMIASIQSSINLANTLPHMSASASLNHSQSGTSSMPANSSREATPDVVCLSDDD